MVEVIELSRDGHGVIEIDGHKYTFFYDPETETVIHQIDYNLAEQYEIEMLIKVEYYERFG